VALVLALAHDNEVAQAYDRGERFDEPVKLSQWGKHPAADNMGQRSSRRVKVLV